MEVIDLEKKRWIGIFCGWKLPSKADGTALATEARGPFTIEVYFRDSNGKRGGHVRPDWRAKMHPTMMPVGRRGYKTAEEAKHSVQSMFRAVQEPWRSC